MRLERRRRVLGLVLLPGHVVDDLWPWILLALLGAYHGLNPAMGWLFAVALGMQERPARRAAGADRRSRSATRLSIVLVAVVVLGLGLLADPQRAAPRRRASR